MTGTMGTPYNPSPELKDKMNAEAGSGGLNYLCIWKSVVRWVEPRIRWMSIARLGTEKFIVTFSRPIQLLAWYLRPSTVDSTVDSSELNAEVVLRESNRDVNGLWVCVKIPCLGYAGRGRYNNRKEGPPKYARIQHSILSFVSFVSRITIGRKQMKMRTRVGEILGNTETAPPLYIWWHPEMDAEIRDAATELRRKFVRWPWVEPRIRWMSIARLGTEKSIIAFSRPIQLLAWYLRPSTVDSVCRSMIMKPGPLA
ncbi:hypothetical protein B0H13DRAFT_1875721 [Mycena leptocephala]|nr:hypothetical protein B0H13DRAFT_1875721 [Mycena leptocephala]